MTIMIGARCKDGVVLVSDRRLVRAGGLELQPSECKLRAMRGVLVGAVGMTAFYDTVERLLNNMKGLRMIVRSFLFLTGSMERQGCGK